MLTAALHHRRPQVGRMNRAMAVNDATCNPITVAEYRQFRLMLLAGNLYSQNGVEGDGGLFSKTKRGLREPPNFGQYMAQFRFKELRRWPVFAFASGAGAERVDDPNVADRTFDMSLHQYRSQQNRQVIMHNGGGIRIIVDERMMPWAPSQTADGGNPHSTLGPRKPDPFGEMTKGAAGPDQWVEAASEPVDSALLMKHRKWGDRWGTTVATTLRLAEGSGGAKINAGEIFCDGWFTGMQLIEALEIEFPYWSVTGILKNNSAGSPLSFLQAYCASRPDRIRAAGFNAFMLGQTKSGKTKVLSISHNTEEGKTKTMLSTAGDCSLGMDYVQSWASKHGGKGTKSVERPNNFVKYFQANGVIDAMNSKHNHELRLFDSWPAKKYFVKKFCQNEGLVFTEMYLQHRQNGMLESMQGTGVTETLMQFLDRFCGKHLKPIRAAPTKVAASPVKSPQGQPTPKAGSKGSKRDQPSVDGLHQARPKSTPKKVKKGGGHGYYVKQASGACKVCKQQGRKTKAQGGRVPDTVTYCEYCDGFVHGRNAGPGFNDCWEHHLKHKAPGLYHSGKQ